MESDLVNAALVIIEATDVIFGGHVPKFNKSIFGAGSDESGIGTKLCRLDPIGMSRDAEKEFAVLQLEALK